MARISPRFIVGLYWVHVPIMLAILAHLYVDSFRVPFQPPMELDFAIWFNLLLNFPHIIFSNLLLLNKKYLVAFKYELLKIAIAAVLLGGAYVAFSSSGAAELAVGLTLVWTVKHVVGQQFAITRMYLRAEAGAIFTLWKTYGVTLGALLFVSMFAQMGYFVVLWPILKAFTRHIYELQIPFLVLGGILLMRALRSGARYGAQLIIANTCMVLISSFAYAESLFLLVGLGPRIVHDFTAMQFYGVHCFNRERSKRPVADHAALLRPLGLFALSAVLGCGLMAVCKQTGNMAPYYTLAALHFCTEAFFWKQDSPARQFIRL